MRDRRTVLASLALALMSGSARADRCRESATPQAVSDYTPVEAHALHQAGAVYLVDVRERDEWQANHIEAALLVPLSAFEAALEGLPRDRPILFYCRTGRRSMEAVIRARTKGATVCGHMGGGINAWMAAGLPVVR
jgi:rhodanese-related sulfurtransferase